MGNGTLELRDGTAKSSTMEKTFVLKVQITFVDITDFRFLALSKHCIVVISK
jgi:hypothetical protein